MLDTLIYVFLISWLEGTRKSLSDWGETQSQGSQAYSAGAQHLSFLKAGSQIIKNLLIWLTLWKDEIYKLHLLLRKTELYLPCSIYSLTDSQVSQVQVPVKDRHFRGFPWLEKLPLEGWENNRHVCFFCFPLRYQEPSYHWSENYPPQLLMSCPPQRQSSYVG